MGCPIGCPECREIGRRHKRGCSVGHSLVLVAETLQQVHGWPYRYAYHVARKRWRSSLAQQMHHRCTKENP
jgi:hypothetical protein